jgi:hypothetical protein
MPLSPAKSSGEKIIHLITQPLKPPIKAPDIKFDSRTQPQQQNQLGNATTEECALLSRCIEICDNWNLSNTKIGRSKEFLRQHNTNLTTSDRAVVESYKQKHESLVIGFESDARHLFSTVSAYLPGKKALFLFLSEDKLAFDERLDILKEQISQFEQILSRFSQIIGR